MSESAHAHTHTRNQSTGVHLFEATLAQKIFKILIKNANKKVFCFFVLTFEKKFHFAELRGKGGVGVGGRCVGAFPWLGRHNLVAGLVVIRVYLFHLGYSN